MNQNTNCKWLAIVSTVVILCFGTPAQSAKFIGLGDLSGGTFNSRANAISANGAVVVGQSNSAFGAEAFRWTSSGMVGLGDFAGGSFLSNAQDVSADGSVAVGFGMTASGSAAYRWTNSAGMVSISNSSSSHASGVSADGSIIVGSTDSVGGTEGFRWTSATGMVELGAPAGFFTFAHAISGDGTVIVGEEAFVFPPFTFEAIRWTAASGKSNLGYLPGVAMDPISASTGVSDDGSVVVGYSDSASGQQAFRWTTGTGMVGLGFLPGSASSRASGVSADGSIVVGSSDSNSGSAAFIWDQTNGIRSIQQVLAPSIGAALNGWTLTSANAVTGDGRTIVGHGTDPNGNQQAWLAYLPDKTYWFPNNSGNWDSAQSWTGPFMPGHFDDVEINPTAAATIQGPSSHLSINSLAVGGNGTGRATLRLTGATQGDLNVATYAYIHLNGELVLGEGRSISVGNLLYNSGVIRGTGAVDSDLINYAEGELRVAQNETLVVSGSNHTNSGKVEVIGGSLEFMGHVNNGPNTSLITARNGNLRFSDGLTNLGSLSFSFGTSDISGDIANNELQNFSGRIISVPTLSR